MVQAAQTTDGSLEHASASPRPARLFELLATGGASVLLFPLSWLARRTLGLDDAELAVGFSTFYAAHVVNDPHFTVTYLLFYRDARSRVSRTLAPELRWRWLVAGVLVPILLVGWTVWAIARHSAPALGAMIELMFLLVGWHYVKQGFGMTMVLSGRRGIVPSVRERRALLFHAFAGWAFAWSNPSRGPGEFEEKGVVYRAVAHPRVLELGCLAVLAVSTVTLLVVLVRERRRLGRTLPWSPLLGFLVTVWMWTIFSAADPLVRYVIPALHSLQYLAFVALMKRNEARAEEGPPTFGRPVAVRLGVLALTAIALGWFVFHAAPSVLDGAFFTVKRGKLPDDLGATPFFAAFFVIVNLHHYAMDAVIWRRDNPDTRFLRAAYDSHVGQGS